ncbi:brain-specific angiogenesis inhibitor 1-associated protein 2-like isoform X1 [Haliotis rufescens]|uniref:brain-specific angiogenesis inhibitor 1-associated protein 2-like isoform X1 n=1 Tax=Haliotis rufescens TaxID=6454 RepID=UPI001EB0AB0A|nr:brain-specific angiogenesis inhibitor 1-associated protein 2-like isoform X1 [Haliotis rufescens]XP_046350388.1 brain-specific angiogenesis inhibitor 1-associated protein 2-like isoform X1 [Haliotis rufescens]
MWNPEDTHKVTEAIYKNITSNFNNGVRQILTAGKAYHKALVGMTSSAHSFIEAIGKVGYACQVNGQGGTDEIGGAILKLADIQKEMYAKVEECTKALFSEVILPLEHRLENDFKHAYAEHKKYQHGHKGYIGPYIKAQEALKKFRKKSKSKFTFDDSKEAQYMRAVAKCQEKLTEFRTQGLKLALLEERKCYCYLLERLTAMASVQTSYTKKGYEMLASEISHWKQLCSQPHILPRSADPLVNRREQRREVMENSQKHQNGMVYPGDSHYGSPYHRPASTTEYMRQKSAPSEYAVPAAMPVESKTLPRGLPSMTQSSPATSNVQAIYAHTGRGEEQLSFSDGDVLTLIGEKADGWQYGLNAHTGKFGWFPLSFTDAVGSSRHTDHSQLLHRAKSIGDLLDSRSQISDISISYEVDMPGRSRRPRSLYESSMVRHITPTSQPSMPTTSSMSPWSSHLYHTTSGDFAPHMLSYGGIGSDTSSARASSGFHTLPRPSPQVDMGSQELYQTLPDPYYDPKILTSQGEVHTLPRQHDHHYQTGLHQQMAQAPQAPQAPPPPPPPLTSQQQHWSGNTSPGFPPPPPPTDYNVEEEDPRNRNPMFANVALRKTLTNDRSAPRLK